MTYSANHVEAEQCLYACHTEHKNGENSDLYDFDSGMVADS